MSDSYARGLERYGLDDVQPLYRRLLLRLKSQDAAAYEEAVTRYREQVEAAVDDANDPLAIWVEYGTWLAPRLMPGQLKAIDEDGRATDAGEPAPLGPLLVHLPDDQKSRALLLAMPAAPSPAQRETAALLCS
jgi:hypothetical protein